MNNMRKCRIVQGSCVKSYVKRANNKRNGNKLARMNFSKESSVEDMCNEYAEHVFFDSDKDDEKRKEPEFPASMKLTREKQLAVRGMGGKLVPSKSTGIRPKGSRNLPKQKKPQEASLSSEEDICRILNGETLSRPPMADFNSSFNDIDLEELGKASSNSEEASESNGKRPAKVVFRAPIRLSLIHI